MLIGKGTWTYASGFYKSETVSRGFETEMEAVCLVVDCGQTASAEVPGGSFLTRSAPHGSFLANIMSDHLISDHGASFEIILSLRSRT